MSSEDALVEDFFRHRHAELVAALTRVFGLAELDLVEDVVQHALLRALETWRIQGAPANPTAWLHRVARNRALDVLRKRSTVGQYAPRIAAEHAFETTPDGLDHVFSPGEIADSQLRMIFTCCHPELPVPSQLALALKTLCGFDTSEVASALLIDAGNAKKRITRARQAFSSGRVEYVVPTGAELGLRRDAVHAVLYALFNAGYYSEHPDGLVRRELCLEAIHLTEGLAAHRVASPATWALLALMCFHAARLPARLDDEGGVLLLEEQDRTGWDESLLSRGASALSRSATGMEMSRYHLEAGIAAKHSLAPGIDQTDWAGVLALYERLMEMVPSPVTGLNRAVAVAFVHGPDAGIAAIDAIADRETLEGRYPLLYGVLGGLHLRAGRADRARVCFQCAAERAASPTVIAFLERQMHRCTSNPNQSAV